jgi:sigma-E factor negative regulatory protein RseB
MASSCAKPLIQIQASFRTTFKTTCLLYLLFVFMLLTMPVVQAQSAHYSEAEDTRESLVWLSKVRSAALRLDYTGVFVYQQGPQVRTSRITHLGKARPPREKLEMLDGEARECIRNGEETICYIPDEKRRIVESRGSEKAFPHFPAAGPDQITPYYRVRKSASVRVAGRDAQAIVLEPKDGLRYGYRLWADKSTGLLLRAQTISENGEVVEQIAFTQLSIGTVPSSQVKASFTDTRGWRTENAVVSHLDLSRWVIKWMPGGFSQIQAVKRLLTDRSSDASRPQREIAQLLYSDGLAGISIFIEPWSPQRSGKPVHSGAVNMVGKRHGEFWLTIVGEVPMVAIRQVADSIEWTATK